MSNHVPVIAHAMHRLYVAGAEVLAADLARKLKGQFRFVFLCLDEIGPLGQQLASEGLAVMGLDRKPGIDWALAKRLRRAIRTHHVDLIHAHQYTPFFYASLSRGLGTRPRILFTEHGRHYPDYRRIKRVMANKFLLRADDRVTSVGQFVKQVLIDHEGLPGDRIQVAYNGIDARRFETAVTDQTRTAVRQELAVRSDQLVVLQVARLHPIKDHATAVRALALAVREVPDALLVLVGDGQQREAIQTLGRQLGVAEHLRLLGVRQDIPRLMAASDMFVLSSLSEGVSVTLLEAMAAGLPIAATDVGGNSEIVVHQETGLLSPRRDEQALARHLVTLLKNAALRRQMGQAGRDRVNRRFTQEQMHQAYTQIYRQMLEVT